MTCLCVKLKKQSLPWTSLNNDNAFGATVGWRVVEAPEIPRKRSRHELQSSVGQSHVAVRKLPGSADDVAYLPNGKSTNFGLKKSKP